MTILDRAEHEEKTTGMDLLIPFTSQKRVGSRVLDR